MDKADGVWDRVFLGNRMKRANVDTRGMQHVLSNDDDVSACPLSFSYANRTWWWLVCREVVARATHWTSAPLKHRTREQLNTAHAVSMMKSTEKGRIRCGLDSFDGPILNRCLAT